MKTEVIIISGFLGSGKSTLLSRIITLEKQQGRKIAVIMNEVGKISVDSEVIPNGIPLKELLNGCICCSLQGELTSQLKSLVEEHKLDAIYIESTGVAHLFEIIEACTHPVLLSDIDIKGVITVVHAKQFLEGKMSIKLKKLLKEQIKYANTIVLNKMDLMSEAEIPNLLERIKEINPGALIIRATYADIDLTGIKNKEVYQLNETDRFGDHAHLQLKMFTFPIQKSVSRITFEEGLSTLSGQLYRVKGFLRLNETPGSFLFNYSYGTPMFERLKEPSSQGEILVFIGENLDGIEIKNWLTQLQNKG